MISVHDNFVYGCSLDFENQRITLHTVYNEDSPHKYTDIVFRGVVAHRFEHILSGNILFDITEVLSDTIVDRDAILFAESWRYGWPPFEYDGDLNVLKSQLRAAGVLGFEVESSYGLSGWVLCTLSERLQRDDRAQIA
jgi:hypothetical protein